jgi:hypothetical protein
VGRSGQWHRLIAMLALAMLALAACGGGSKSATTSSTSFTASTAAGPAPQLPLLTTPAPWPRPDHVLDRARAAGLHPDVKEHLTYHVHAHLDVFVDGRAVVVPALIGIDVSSARSYPCRTPCVSPLHTHDESGVLHTEAGSHHDTTLGQFFTEWGVRLTPACVGGYCRPATAIHVYVDGAEWTGDPRDIRLKNLEEVAVVIGEPPSSIPDRFPTG